MNQRVPILVYHHVYPNDNPELAIKSNRKASGVIGEAEFRRHMDYVLTNGWQVVSTTQVVETLDGDGDLPERAVVLHFDNGWLDAHTIVMPILNDLGLTGTCYVISEPTDAASKGLPAGIRTSTEGFVYKPFLTWEHCRDLLDAGWEIGAHTATHPRMAEVYNEHGAERLLAEVAAPNAVYLKNLGFVPDHFAYPSGSRSAITDELLSQHYRSLRRWTFDQPPVWEFTDRQTPLHALKCQNVDNTVAFEDFTRIFDEALEE